jgi:hypothetical protein
MSGRRKIFAFWQDLLAIGVSGGSDSPGGFLSGAKAWDSGE